MQINYSLTEEDYLNFNMFHIKNSKTAINAMKKQRFLPPILFLILSFVFSAAGDVSFLGMFITFFLISILWVIFYPKYFYSYVIRNTKKMVKEGKNGDLLGNHTMMMTKEGIVDSTSIGETKVNWSGMMNFKEDNDYFYLYNSSISAYIIPKRELKDIEKIRNYLKSKVTH